MRHVEEYKSFNALNESSDKNKPLYKKGQKVKYVGKISGFDNNKILTINRSKWVDSDEISELFDLKKESEPTWMYTVNEMPLYGKESDFKKA